MTTTAVAAPTASAGAVPRGAPWTPIALAGAYFILSALVGADRTITVVAVIVQLLFFAFFARHLAFAISAMRSARSDLAAPLLDTGRRPRVTVIVACKNEEAVVDGLVSGLLALEYPDHRVQRLVVDDASDDGTGARLDEWAARDDRLTVVHRPVGRGGGKSGALNDGLDLATGEIVVVFDADHRPRTDVLRRLVRHFDDPTVAAVQGRCEIRNAGDSPLTHLIAVDYLAGYLINEYGRQSLFRLPAYGGANCAVRADALRAVGGWNPHTVTEDTDLTMRLVLAGFRVRYDVTAVDEEEGVVTLDRYWRQRYRWARGHQQVWRDYRGAVWRSPLLTWSEKLESLMFLLVFHLPVLSAFGLGLLVLWLAGLVHPIDPLHAYVMWTLLFLGPLTELGGGLLVARADRRNALVLGLFLPIFFVSIALCTKAWIDGVLGRPYSWVKTARATDAPRTPA